jgi:hypothetical protein
MLLLYCCGRTYAGRPTGDEKFPDAIRRALPAPVEAPKQLLALDIARYGLVSTLNIVFDYGWTVFQLHFFPLFLDYQFAARRPRRGNV